MNHKFNVVTILGLFFLSMGNAQTLIEFKNEAWENHPKIKAWNQKLLGVEESVNQEGGLPNTNISAGYFVGGPETRTGAQRAKLGVMQPLPWFGTIKAKKSKVAAEAEVIKNKLEILKKEVALKVESTYYSLYELKAKQKILAKQDTLLAAYIDIALKAVENNEAPAVEVLKLNIEKNNIQYQKEILAGDILTFENTLNQLLHRDGFDELSIPDNLYIPDEEPTLLLEDIEYHPELLNFDRIIEVIDQKRKVNQKEKQPNLGLGVDYIIVDERPDISLNNNGQDIIVPMVSLSIPLFSKKHTSKSKQFDLQEEEVSYQREAKQNDLENLMEKAMNNRITARINLDTQLKNIHQTEQVEKMTLSGFEAAQVNFSEVLHIQKMLLDLQKKKIEAIAEYFRQSAIINYLQ